MVVPKMATMAVIDCALQKRRDDRYASANELAAALAMIRARIPATNPSTDMDILRISSLLMIETLSNGLT